MNVSILRADLASEADAAAVLSLLDEYARDPMGGGTPLAEYSKTHLIAALRERPATRVLLAREGDAAVGLLIAFEGFSTFACKPLLNIHDVVVTRSRRGQGIGRQLFEAVERNARESGCCKLTLEVLEGNQAAQKLYRSLGFAGYELDPKQGRALFWEKKLV